MLARVAIFGVAAPVLLHACSSPWGFAAAACGALTGSALAWLGLRLTAHESTPEGQFYTTNAWIAATVSVLFLGRIASRFLALYTLAEAGDAGGISAGDLQTSPLTLGSSFVLVGYYVVYFGGVLWRVRGVTRLATDPAPTQAAR